MGVLCVGLLPSLSLFQLVGGWVHVCVCVCVCVFLLTPGSLYLCACACVHVFTCVKVYARGWVRAGGFGDRGMCVCVWLGG